MRLDVLEACKNIVQKEHVVADDFERFFNLWRRNKVFRTLWPGNILYHRIRPLAECIQENDVPELVLLLKQILSLEPNSIELLKGEKWLELDSPVPRIEFSGKVFCFISSFAFDSKEKCAEAVSFLGGAWVDFVDEKTDYLIIGTKNRKHLIAEDQDFILNTAGAIKAKGGKCKVILEEYWIRELPQDSDFREKISGHTNYAGELAAFKITINLNNDGNPIFKMNDATSSSLEK